MSLRCSLLGHEYGEGEIEREREERGSEVVISVTELERCVRCGTVRTISENTEVTQRSPRSPRSRSAGDSTPDPEPEPTPDATAEPTPADAGEPTDPERSVGTPEPDFDPDPAVDDAEIIEDGPADRDAGDWPERDDHREADTTLDPDAGTTEWPSVEDDDEGFDASLPGDTDDADFEDELTPQSTDRGAEIIEGVEEAPAAGDTAFVRVGASAAPDQPAPDDATELYCPNCNGLDLSGRDSLRQGDICPACHRGYLAERER